MDPRRACLRAKWPGAVANPAVLNEVFRITGVEVAHNPVKMLKGNPPNASLLISHMNLVIVSGLKKQDKAHLYFGDEPVVLI